VGIKQVVLTVALLNFAYFFVEFSVGLRIGSVSLFADSIDFLEDSAVNLLIFLAFSWSARSRARVGMLLAAILLVPGLATAWAAWQKFHAPIAPSPYPLSLAGLGALAVNFSCALLLARHRNRHGSLARAAFLSARNDVFANIAIMLAGFVTIRFPSAWPDLIVGIAIAAVNLDAAREVWEAAREERRTAA
jgi:Co/Zn/Cd efflux system component